MADTDVAENTEEAPAEEGGLDEEEDDGEIKMVSKKDKETEKAEEYSVSKKYIFISKLVKVSIDNDPMATTVPLPGVSGKILGHIVSYMNHHKGVAPEKIDKGWDDPEGGPKKTMQDICRERKLDVWDADYIDKIAEDKQDLYDIILAANYMDIQSLLYLGCAKMAWLIKGKPLEDIKDILTKCPMKEKKRRIALKRKKSAELRAKLKAERETLS